MSGNLKAVENDAAELTDDLGDLLEDVDISQVDLTMDPDYELRVVANQRMGRVKEANTLRWDMAANKAGNPQQYDKLRQEYTWRIWEIAMLDKRFPAAKALCLQLMATVARQEAEAQERLG